MSTNNEEEGLEYVKILDTKFDACYILLIKHIADHIEATANELQRAIDEGQTRRKPCVNTICHDLQEELRSRGIIIGE